MKKTFVTSICMYAATLMTAGYSQKINLGTQQFSLTAPGIENSSWEKVINRTSDYRNSIDIKVVRDFISNFKEPGRVVWNKLNGGDYIARFSIDSVKTTICYNHNGSWDYMYKEYNGDLVPDYLRKIIKHEFEDFEIVKVKEIHLPLAFDITYSVLIKEFDNCKILKIVNDQLEIFSELKDKSCLQ